MKRSLITLVIPVLAMALFGCPLCVKVTVEPATITLKTGGETPLTASSTAQNDTFEWSSGNNEIANVDETGLVRAWAPGEVEITATSTLGGAKGSCVVTVLNRGEIVAPMTLGVPYEFTMDIGQEPGVGTWTWSGAGKYAGSNPGESGWIGGGDAMGWNAGPEGQWELALDWPFTFDTVDYTAVTVTNRGEVFFGDPDDYLYAYPFQADLSTELEGHDIFVAKTDTYTAIRWACALAGASSKQNEAPINFEIVLWRTGEIAFNYGVITYPTDPVASSTSPTGPRIGISTQYISTTSDLNHSIEIPEGASRLWTYDPGRTPPGLTMSEDGVISGTPEEITTVMFVIEYFVDGHREYYNVVFMFPDKTSLTPVSIFNE